VLLGYGTGAIGGVPAHDERDLEFAKKFDLPIVVVVQPTGDEPALGFTGEGVAINSPIINGLTSANAKKKITAWLEERGLGKRAINYKLRDWLFSRQRYWGEPFPIVWENGKHRALPGKRMPSRSVAARRLQTDRMENRRWQRQKSGSAIPKRRSARQIRCRSGQAHVVLPAFCDPHNDKRFVAKRRNVLDGGDQPGSVDCTSEELSTRCCTCFTLVLAKSVIRPGLPLEARAVPAVGEPGNHPRRGQPENVEIAREHR